MKKKPKIELSKDHISIAKRLKQLKCEEYITHSPEEMMELGQRLAKICSNSCVIYLEGVLGAGKTTLVRGFLRALGYTKAVKSPTYTLVETYILNNNRIYHFDLYRINNIEELEQIGIRDYFSEPGIALIEWPEHAKGIIPKADVTCAIEVIGDSRKVKFRAC